MEECLYSVYMCTLCGSLWQVGTGQTKDVKPGKSRIYLLSQNHSATNIFTHTTDIFWSSQLFWLGSFVVTFHHSWCLHTLYILGIKKNPCILSVKPVFQATTFSRGGIFTVFFFFLKDWFRFFIKSFSSKNNILEVFS